MISARIHRRPVIHSRAVIASVVAAIVIAACGGEDDGGSAERFCGEIEANKEALTNPQLEFSDDIGPLLQLYSHVGDVAPLSIAEEWNQLVSAYETASTVVP
ncbi:MAG: hypothetical protein DRJ50_01985, partial [Actinobacteria bacterium]